MNIFQRGEAGRAGGPGKWGQLLVGLEGPLNKKGRLYQPVSSLEGFHFNLGKSQSLTCVFKELVNHRQEESQAIP